MIHVLCGCTVWSAFLFDINSREVFLRHGMYALSYGYDYVLSMVLKRDLLHCRIVRLCFWDTCVSSEWTSEWTHFLCICDFLFTQIKLSPQHKQCNVSVHIVTESITDSYNFENFELSCE